MITNREKTWAGVVLSSFAGSDEGFTVRAGEVDYEAGVATYLKTASEKARLGLRFAFVLAYTAPLWLWGRFRTLSSLDRQERSRALDEMSRHSIYIVRELNLLLKLIACMAIFRSPEARARTSFDRPSDRAADKAARRGLPLVSEEAA